MNRTTPLKVKKVNGRSSFTNRTMVSRMRTPSRMVLSLEAEPGGRSRYGVSTSPIGIASSSAWTVNSVSVSKPTESAGKDFTKRRENTR